MTSRGGILIDDCQLMFDVQEDQINAKHSKFSPPMRHSFVLLFLNQLFGIKNTRKVMFSFNFTNLTTSPEFQRILPPKFSTLRTHLTISTMSKKRAARSKYIGKSFFSCFVRMCSHDLLPFFFRIDYGAKLDKYEWDQWEVSLYSLLVRK